MKILVTGSTGKLGTALVNQLAKSGHTVKLTSRTKPEMKDSFEWVYSDLLSGDGIDEAVEDVEVIIHAATSPVRKAKAIEVSGLEKLLSKAQHVKHFVYPSIVGIDDIPMKYYKLKSTAEEILQNSSIPHTIARATQFHSFVDQLFLSRTFFKRYLILGDLKFQSVDESEFAAHLLDMIDHGPQKRADDFAGPVVMSLKEMAEFKIKICNEAHKCWSFPWVGKLYRSIADGKNTNPNQAVGKITYEEYLRRKMGEVLN